MSRGLGDATIQTNCVARADSGGVCAGHRGCSSDLSLNNLTLVPKPETLMRPPDWATFSRGKTGFSLRPVTPADLVNADGQCAAAPGRLRASRTRQRRGCALRGRHRAADDGMRRVVRRAGPVEKLDVGADERGERAVVLTYARGSSAGVYRFVGGRLVSIERVPGPPPAPAKAQRQLQKTCRHLTARTGRRR